MASIAELKGLIGELRRDEKELLLKVKAVRGKIAAAQLELMAARRAEEGRARSRSRSRSPAARASSESSGSEGAAGGSDDAAGASDGAEGASDGAEGGGDAVAAAAAPPPAALPDLALVPHQGGRAAGRGRGRGRGRAQHPKRPAGRCRACWYRQLGVPGGTAHTGGAGCDRGGA